VKRGIRIRPNWERARWYVHLINQRALFVSDNPSARDVWKRGLQAIIYTVEGEEFWLSDFLSYLWTRRASNLPCMIITPATV